MSLNVVSTHEEKARKSIMWIKNDRKRVKAKCRNQIVSG